MAIRIRVVDGTVVALCAAKTKAEPGDILYLNDNVHHALSTKFGLDFHSEGIMPEALADPNFFISDDDFVGRYEALSQIEFMKERLIELGKNKMAVIIDWLSQGFSQKEIYQSLPCTRTYINKTINFCREEFAEI